MSLFAAAKRSETEAVLQCFSVVECRTGIKVGDVLASFRAFEIDLSANTEGLFRVDALVDSEVCFIEVTSIQVGDDGVVAVATRKVAETTGYFDSDGVFASSNALSFVLGRAVAGGGAQKAFKVVPTGPVGARIAICVAEIQAREVELPTLSATSSAAFKFLEAMDCPTRKRGRVA